MKNFASRAMPPPLRFTIVSRELEQRDAQLWRYEVTAASERFGGNSADCQSLRELLYAGLPPSATEAAARASLSRTRAGPEPPSFPPNKKAPRSGPRDEGMRHVRYW